MTEPLQGDESRQAVAAEIGVPYKNLDEGTKGCDFFGHHLTWAARGPPPRTRNTPFIKIIVPGGSSP